jgi:hypothetical protein
MHLPCHAGFRSRSVRPLDAGPLSHTPKRRIPRCAPVAHERVATTTSAEAPSLRGPPTGRLGCEESGSVMCARPRKTLERRDERHLRPFDVLWTLLPAGRKHSGVMPRRSVDAAPIACLPECHVTSRSQHVLGHVPTQFAQRYIRRPGSCRPECFKGAMVC